MKKNMKNFAASLKLVAVVVLMTGAYWLSYGMKPGSERPASIAAERVRKEAEQQAQREGKTPEQVKEAGRQAAGQEYVARGRRPSVSRTPVTPIVTGVPIPASAPIAQPVAPKPGAVKLPNLAGKRKIAALIIDDQYDFMQLPFTDNALGGNEVREGGRLAVGQADQNMLNDTAKFLAGWKKEKDFSQDWHPAGHVSHDTTFVKKTSIGTANPEYAPLWKPLGDSAKDYVAVGAPGVSGGCVGVDNFDPNPDNMKGKVAVIPSQFMWPVHCVQGTVGAEIPDVLFTNGYAAVKNPNNKIADGLYGDKTTKEYIIEKGYHCYVDSYSAFLDVDKKTQTALSKHVADQGITDVAIMGIAIDYCVGDSAEDAVNAGLNVHYLVSLSRGVASDTMEAKLQKLSKLQAPNGARVTFYHLTDVDDKGYSENLLTKAGLWNDKAKTVHMTTAEFYALADAIEAGKPAAVPAKPAATPTTAPVAPGYITTSEEEPTEGYGESEDYPVHEELMARYKAQQTERFDAPKSIAKWKKLRDDELNYYVEMQDPAGKKYVLLALDDESKKRIGLRIVTDRSMAEYNIDGSLDQEIPLAPVSGAAPAPSTPVISGVPTPTAPAASVAMSAQEDKVAEKKYEAQKKVTVSKAPNLKGGAIFMGTNYILITFKPTPRAFYLKKQPGDKYKIEFQNNTYEYEYDANKNLIVSGASAVTPAAPTYIETPKEEPTFGWSEEEENPTEVSTPAPVATGQAAGLEKKYKAQMTKNAPVKLLDLSKELTDGTATIAGNYVEVSEGLRRQVFMKKADGGYKIEFKDNMYELDAQGNLIAPGASASAPAAPVAKLKTTKTEGPVVGSGLATLFGNPIDLPFEEAKPAPSSSLVITPASKQSLKDILGEQEYLNMLKSKYVMQQARIVSSYTAGPQFKKGLDMKTAEAVGDYAGIDIGSFNFALMREGDGWKIEFEDVTYMYDKDGKLLKEESKRL